MVLRLKHVQAAGVWSIGLVFSLAAHAVPQMVEVYTSTDPTANSNTNDATLVLETVVEELDFPIGGNVYMWYPRCVEGTSEADCNAAMDIYGDVQETVKDLGDKWLGNNGTLSVIRMYHYDPVREGLYDPVRRVIVLSRDHTSGTVAHETAHDYFRKHHGVSCPFLPCNEAEIKKVGVDEGFAKIVAHRVFGSHPPPASADSVEDILAGASCSDLGTQSGASSCAHDLGNLVFDGYEEVVEELGKSEAFNIYRKALLETTTVTPAALHERVSNLLMAKARREGMAIDDGDLPALPDPFALSGWRVYLGVFWELC